MKAKLHNAVTGGLSRALRIAQLGAVRVAASISKSLHRQAKHLEVRLDGLHKGLDVRSVTDIPWPAFDMAECDDPVLTILSAREFESRDTILRGQSCRPTVSRLAAGAGDALCYSAQSASRPCL